MSEISNKKVSLVLFPITFVKVKLQLSLRDLAKAAKGVAAWSNLTCFMFYFPFKYLAQVTRITWNEYIRKVILLEI